MPLELDDFWQTMEPTENRRLSRIVSTLSAVAGFLRERGHLDEAIEVLKALSWGDETYECGDYAFALGLCYEAKCSFPEALRFFEIALRENPPVPGRAEAVERLKALVPEALRLSSLPP
ncbi:MAG: hypothetical protein ACRDBL_05920 [Rhabdaerophilum sp.]